MPYSYDDDKQTAKQWIEAGTMIVATFVFLPENYAGIKHDRHEEAIARQHWGSTKGLY
jgi:hypothetical protein